MEKKKVLIISGSFYPMNSPRSFRTTELAKELARQGHEVTVLTPKIPEHIDFEEKHGLTIKDLGQLTWKPIELKGRGSSLLLRRAIRRFSSLLVEYPNIQLMGMVEKALKKEEQQYDLLISIAVPYPVHWGVAKMWKGESDENPAKVWIADCGDPFMGAENDTFKPLFHFKYIEKWFCKKVDYLTVPVKTAVQAYYPEFHDKIKVIPQGFNFDEVKTAPKEEKPHPHFAYAGGLIPGRRDPKAFFEYLISLDQDYVFDIYTNSEALVRPYADKSKGRIRLKHYIPRLDLLFELSKLDFVVNFENAGQKQIPSKLIDYSIIKKPILSVNSFNYDSAITDEFFKANYTNAFQLENLEDYKIENVANAFLNLSKTS
jgi:hypothetical protein